MKIYPGELIKDCKAVHGLTGRPSNASKPNPRTERVFGTVTPDVKQSAKLKAAEQSLSLSAYVSKLVTESVVK